MFGPLGLPELIFILGLALLVFGPKRLPEIGRTFGRGMAEFRKATNEVKRTLAQEIDLDDTSPSPAKSAARPTMAAQPAPNTSTSEAASPTTADKDEG